MRHHLQYCTTRNKEWQILNIAPSEKTVSPLHIQGGKSFDCTPKMNQYTFKLLTVTTHSTYIMKALKCKPSAKSAALPCPNIAYGRDVLLRDIE